MIRLARCSRASFARVEFLGGGIEVTEAAAAAPRTNAHALDGGLDALHRRVNSLAPHAAETDSPADRQALDHDEPRAVKAAIAPAVAVDAEPIASAGEHR